MDVTRLFKHVKVGPSRHLREGVARQRDGRELVTLVMEEQLDNHLIRPFIDALMSIGHREQLDLFLYGHGGVAEVSWWTISLLREFADHIAVLVPFRALSGMTHIALAADELFMSEVAVLGAVDPRRTHPLLPRDNAGKPVPVSVEDLKQCMNFVTEQAQQGGIRDVRDVVVALFDHVNPLGLGALERSYALSRLITEKALKRRQKPPTGERIEHIVDQLGGGYFSHDFVLARADVRNDLGIEVEAMSPGLSEACWDLYLHYEQSFTRANQVTEGDLTAQIVPKGFIETSEKRFGLMEFRLSLEGEDTGAMCAWLELDDDGAPLAIATGGEQVDDSVQPEEV